MRLSGPSVAGLKVLILGEVGAGKTRLTAALLKDLLEVYEAREITVIDMAPPRRGGVGGRLRSYLPEIQLRYLEPREIVPPRLTGRTAEEVLALAKANYEAIKPLIRQFSEAPTKVLVINDLSIYLHYGPLDDILACVARAETFLANSYYGRRLEDDKGSGLSARERGAIDALAKHMDLVIHLPAPGQAQLLTYRGAGVHHPPPTTSSLRLFYPSSAAGLSAALSRVSEGRD